ncbi:MAG: ATP-binding cassette domain-containing protein [Methanoregula sp.]|nr:ATP-binding cassette domain-containing protein [Methanoregula sp.]
MSSCTIHEITILPGHDKYGNPEQFEPIVIRPGDTISIVGPTGSGKTAFINDIEVFAQDDTSTGRTVLVNGEIPPEEFIRDPSKKPIALITQNTKCLADMTVGTFLAMHVRARRIDRPDIITETIDLANQFTGEQVQAGFRISALSGGQTRALMVADAILISNAPLILLDEVENAGIFRERVIGVLKEYCKSVIFVTHDPLVSLLSDRRIVMRHGGVEKVLCPEGRETHIRDMVSRMDVTLCRFRERIRAGELLTEQGFPV